MLDPHFGMLAFASFALVIGVVVFGGTTLAYFLGNRRSGRPNPVPTQRLHQQSKATVTGDSLEVPRDRAA